MLPTFAQHALWRPKAREMIGKLMEARDSERLRKEIQHGVRLAKSLGLDIADVALPSTVSTLESRVRVQRMPPRSWCARKKFSLPAVAIAADALISSASAAAATIWAKR